MERPRLPGQRAGLTRGDLLKTARELLAEGGLDALTMRALAARLGVAPNALYSHVAGKMALIDDVLDDVLAEVEAPAGDEQDAGAALHALMASTYDVLLAHPELVPLFMTRQGARGPNAQRLGDIMLALLARDHSTGSRALEARRVLIIYTIGFAAFTTRPPLEPADGAPLPSDEIVKNFDSGLRWLLAGIGRPTGR